MDQAHDLSGRELYRLSQLLDAPAFVKEAEAGDLSGPSDLPPEVYGDPAHRMYPCHTPAATWTSTAFFLDKKASLNPRDVPYIADRLAWYANYHGIAKSINDLQAKYAAAHQTQAPVIPDEDYGLVLETDGEKIRRYPLRNSAEVKTAAAYLHAHRDNWPYRIRQAWADKIFHKAAEHATDLGEHADYIERQAGYGACTAKEAAGMLRDRVNAARKGPGPLSELQSELVKLALSVEDHPAQIHAAGTLVKLAEVVDAFDRDTGLHRQYGEGLRRPEDILFELTGEKMASVVKEHVPTTTGNIYLLADLEKLSADHIRLYMGGDFADAVLKRNGRVDTEKAAEVIPTLDRSLADMFDGMMSAAGLQPAAKEAGAPVGFSRDYLLAMAEDYRRSGGIPGLVG